MKYQRFLSVLVLVMSLLAVLSSGCGMAGRYGKGIEPTSGPEITAEGIRFSLFSTRVDKVCIAGDFNNWSMTADPLYDSEGTGLWSVVLPLPPGRYEYKFILDGEKWVADPGNDKEVDDGFGSTNSVIVVE